MAQSITISSFNQIIGAMLRTIIAETPLNDINAGSVLLTLLEACAAQDFENNTAILNILELLNIDAVQNSDLDDRAADYGLTRNPAIAASGLVNILNNNITKQSSGLYVLNPAPIAGQTVLYLNNTTGWTPTGTIYIGRGTQSFEGPIPYTSITVFPTYSQLNLGAALQRDHLLSDSVVNSQGQPDYSIAAGTVVNIPANNQKPEVQYQTLVDAVIPAGEVIASNVAVIAIVAGSQGNAGIHTITSFDTPPFTGAGVINTNAFSNGVDPETDTELRNRIKNYATTLARGTALSIVDAVIGVSDPVDSLQVASAVIQEPAKVGLPAILYIDDGYGLQPTFQGQSVDTLVTNATGTESFLQLANFPLPRPQVINTASGPFSVTSGSFLRVIVDGVQEDITFINSNFQNPAAATLAEIIIVINTNSKLINARFVDNSQFLLIYPIAPDAEIIQVVPISSSDNPLLYLNSLLLFPTNEFSFISLFRNATRLHEQAHSASLETIAFGLWNVASTQDLLLSVDNTPAQDQAFPISNFVGASSFAALTLDDWVTAFNNQFAGITATATASQTMLISSNKIGSTSALNVEGGSLLTKLFPGQVVTSVGQSSDFALNRQTGNLDVFEINAGDNISAGIVDAKGFDISAKTVSGTYNLDSDSVGRPAEMVIVADSTFCDQVSIPLLIGSTLAISNPPTYPSNYSFTVASANATAGAVYSNNGETFTVSTTIVAGTTLTTTVIPSNTLAPLPSGTLTLVSGTGDATITFSAFVASGSVMRIMSSTLSAFQALAPGDFIYMVSRTTGWLDPANTGLFRIIDRGHNINAGTDSFIDVLNATIVPQGSVTVQDPTDVQGFRTDGLPQIWRGEYVINPAAALITDVVSSLNTDLLNVKASIYNTTAIKITSTTERDGSIAVPVVTPQMSTLFAATQHAQLGNPPLLANLVSSKDLVSSFKRTTPVSANVWLGRYTYSDIKGSIDTDNTPDSYPFAATYGEIISSPQLSPANVSYDDYVSFTLGQNRDQFKSVKAIGSGGGLLLNSIGTQQGTARSELDYIVGDTFDLIRPIQLSPADTIVFIMDKNPTNNTINIPMARLGQVNSGNGTGADYVSGDPSVGSFIPDTTQFSANDAGNQPGIDFGNTVVWGTSVNNTDFSDYDVWMQARNWYAGGGYGSGQGVMLLRAAQFGLNGENIQFSIAYPSAPNQAATTTYINTSSLSEYAYFFGSGAARAISLPANTTIVVTNSSGDYYNYTFSGGSFTSVMIGDLISINSGSGVSADNSGQFLVTAKNGNQFTVYNPSAIVSPVTSSFTAIFGSGVSVLTPYSMTGLVAGQVLNDTTLGTNLVAGTYITSVGVTTINISNPTAAASGGADTITYTAPSESVVNTNLISMFPLNSNDVATIIATINADLIMTATAVGDPSLTIAKSTAAEDYSYGGNLTALAYGHNPTVSLTRGHIGLYDSIAWAKTFANTNPNFTLKNALLLNDPAQVNPSVYSMNTAPNVDGSLGEYFNLLPSTVKNVYHQFTQPALSQLPIVANIAITNDRKNVQVDSLQLGSAGAIEVVGGNANKSQAYILNESDVVSDSNGSSLQLITPAFPDTYNVGDFVLLQNDSGVKRLSRLSAADNINVTIPSSDHANYNYDPKATLIGTGTTFTITDVSGSYGRAAGFVWRWTFGAGPTVAAVNPGDLLMAFGPNMLSGGWSQGNLARVAGNGEIAGLPIVAVNDGSSYFDVVNPNGVAMSATAVGAGDTVQICPTPAIRWNLAHAAKVQISTMSRTSNVITVTTASPHFLENGYSIDIADSFFVPDGSYTVTQIVDITSFKFSLTGSNFTESSVGATVIKTGIAPTRYRVEKLGFNGMVRIEWYDGASPMFADSGVAVDDYVVFSGSTFEGNNNGIFRVTSVDNSSIMIVNPAASDQLNTIEPFNNNGFLASWAANSNIVTGVAGTFKELSVGDWVKKTGDDNELFLQVTGFIPSTAPTATTISLGGNYAGATGTSSGVFWNELLNYNTGIYLQDADDLAVYEGDAAMVGDLLSVQNIINPAWFNVANIGNFDITSVGTDPVLYKPFVEVVNPAALAQVNASMSVNIAGFYITESDANKYYSVRQVSHVALNDINPANRDIYVVPSDHSYKFTNANATSILSQGKLGYSTEVTTGIDGYLYYTGLLQVVQRLVDGFEPDQTDYPGLRAVGGLIETLPPLVNTIKISINVATNNGVNLGDITDSIQSVIIDYVQGLGVGQDVILSEIIAQVMNITGVAAVTFTNPAPSTERITIAFNERANITPAGIGIANG